MPWKLRKAPKRPLYWVVDDNNKHYSKEPLPLERAKAQLKALYSAQSRGEIKGGGDADFAKAAYESKAPASVDGYALMVSTPTLKIYGKDGDYIVAIRGTYSTEDAKADASLAVGTLSSTARYKKDAEVLRRFREGHSGSYRGIGHSLGGAILDQFLKDGLVDSGTSFNPAVSPGDFDKELKNKRIYKEGDPLYQLMGRHTKGAEVRKEKPSLTRKLVSFIPYFGKLYNAYKSHQIEGFGLHGGNREEELARLRHQLYVAEAEEDEERVLELLRRIQTLEIGEPEGPPPNAGYDTPAHSNPATRPSSAEDPRRPRPSSAPIRMTAADLFANPSPMERPPVSDWTDAELVEEARALGMERLADEFEAEVYDRENPEESDLTPEEAEANYQQARGLVVRILSRRRGGGKETQKVLAHKNSLLKRADELEKGKLIILQSELEAMANLLHLPENQNPDRRALIHHEYDKTEDEMLEVVRQIEQLRRTAAKTGKHIKYALEVDSSGKKRSAPRERRPSGLRHEVVEGEGLDRSFLKRAKARAKKSGYDPKLLKLAEDGVHKLVYDGVPFGRKGYGDFLFYTEMERLGKVPKGTAQKKQSVFVKSHSAMKGDWKKNPKSPNNLALHILW